MNSNQRKFNEQLCGAFFALTSVALLSAASMMAQNPQQNSGYQRPSTPTTAPGQQSTTGAVDSAAQAAQGGNGQMMDKMFLRKALQGGMAEVQLGQLALQKSSNDDVKQFAQKMIDDHTKLGDQMKPLAQQMNVKIPDGPSAKDQATMTKLQALNGDAFDKAYIRDMVKDHEKDQKDFKQEAASTSNPDLKQAVTQGEQVITEHLQMIKQIAQKDNVVASK